MGCVGGFILRIRCVCVPPWCWHHRGRSPAGTVWQHWVLQGSSGELLPPQEAPGGYWWVLCRCGVLTGGHWGPDCARSARHKGMLAPSCGSVGERQPGEPQLSARGALGFCGFTGVRGLLWPGKLGGFLCGYLWSPCSELKFPSSLQYHFHAPDARS